MTRNFELLLFASSPARLAQHILFPIKPIILLSGIYFNTRSVSAP
jgi:hypothetical protein